MLYTLVSNDFKVNLVTDIISDIQSGNNSYYLFASNPNTIPNTNNVIISDDVYDSQLNPFGSMLYGKKINSTDIYPIIKNYNWVSNTYYSMYDHQDSNLINKPFYTIVNTGNNYYVWKCLDNNFNSPSLVYPNYADLSPADDTYQTSDGYIWKYIYSVNSSIVTKFTTLDYFPVSTDSNVVSSAVEGAIYSFKIANTGYGYSNYLSGTFSVSDVQLNGNSLIYAVSNSASLSNTFYSGCLIYISSGVGIGQYRKVTDYIANTTSKYIVIDSPFSVIPQNGTKYEIYPNVTIWSNMNTSNCVARAIISPNGNTIQQIQVLSSGSGYKSATATINYSNVINVTVSANIYPIMPPKFGHGSNPLSELYCRGFAISTYFANTESNTIPQDNKINQIGIIKNPRFSNVVITVSNTNGLFNQVEKIYTANFKLFDNNANIALNNTTITSTNSDFTNQLTSNTLIYASGNNNALLSKVNTISNSTYMTISTPSYFTSNNSNLYFVNTHSTANLDGVVTNVLTLNDLSNPIYPNNIILGSNSSATGYINTISINDSSYNFNTFVGMYYYKIQGLTGTFINDEQVISVLDPQFNAYVHSVKSLGGNNYLLYVYNLNATFNASEQIMGLNSRATANIVSVYRPHINYNQGDILYLQNINTINRATNANNSFNITFTF